MKTLETNRLILRPFRESDLEDFYRYASTPNVGPPAGWAPHQNKQESLKILRDFIREDQVWAIVDKISQKVIGSLGLHESQERCPPSRMMGYALSEEYWGKGLMTEAVARALRFAFEELGLELVWISHYPFNRQSQRVIQKSGFTYEGTIRRAVKRYDGAVLDHVVYSITKEEYRRQHPDHLL